MSGPSLDLYWPRDVVGRTLAEHPMVPAWDGGYEVSVWCRGCGVVVADSSQHLMFALLAAVEKLRPAHPEATLADELPIPDRRESSIGFDRTGGDAA